MGLEDGYLADNGHTITFAHPPLSVNWPLERGLVPHCT